MTKKIFLQLLLIIIFVDSYAVPANNVIKIVNQPDGTTLSVVLCGDEYFHFYATEDKLPLIETENGAYCYLNIQQQKLISTGIVAHDSEKRTSGEKEFLEKNMRMIRDGISEVWQQRKVLSNSNTVKTRSEKNSERNYLKGKARGLVVLIEFADKSMHSEQSQALFNRQFNEIGFSENHHIGSVHDYFYDQSYGQFDLTFDVVGPIAVSHDIAYYGSNSNNTDGNDRYPGEMVTEACKIADQYVNFADYDWDKDGEVENVYFIYAGYGESNGADSKTIWPHKSSLSSRTFQGDGEGSIILDGVKIDTYACSCELAGSSGKTINGIGTACHEFSHCLGLPDFYDTDYNGGFGMNYWDLMASGSHSGPKNIGEVPCGFTAYEKWFMGWLDYVELSEPTRIKSMNNIGDEPIAYVTYNDNNRNEYFILENRQNKGWYSYVKTTNQCHGLLITHVDYDEKAWQTNNVNSSAKHQRMSIVPADNSYGKLNSYKDTKEYSVTEEQLLGDLYPGLLNIVALTNTSHVDVGGKWYNRNKEGSYEINKPIESISEKNGKISFDFMGGVLVPVPKVKKPTNINKDSFTANWEPVTNVDSYNIQLSELEEQGAPLDNVLLKESLKNFISTNASDGFEDLSSVLDQYMENKGWEGLKVFTSPNGAKIGSSSVNGRLKSPMANSVSGNITVSFAAKSYDANDTFIDVVIYSDNGKNIIKQMVPIIDEMKTYVTSITNVKKGDCQVEITSPNRFYIEDIAIYDGYYSKEVLKSDIYVKTDALKPVDSDYVYDVMSNSYTFQNLKGLHYRYRVQACIDGSKSVWSDWVQLSLNKGTGILSKIVDNNSNKYFYDLMGRKVDNPKASRLYILYDGKERRKVIIRSSKQNR